MMAMLANGLRAYWLLVTEKDGEWHYSCARMRRWINGRWQYREMTDAEETTEWNLRQW